MSRVKAELNHNLSYAERFDVVGHTRYTYVCYFEHCVSQQRDFGTCIHSNNSFLIFTLMPEKFFYGRRRKHRVGRVIRTTGILFFWP